MANQTWDLLNQTWDQTNTTWDGIDTLLPSYHSTLGARIDVEKPESGLDARIIISGAGGANLSAKISIFSNTDLDSRIKIVEYLYTNMLASIYVIPYKNLPAKLTIKPKKNLLARCTVYRGIKGKIFVYPKDDFDAKITVMQTETKNLGAKLSIPTNEDLGAQINVLRGIKEFEASITVTLGGQYLGAKITISGSSPLDAKITVDVTDQLLGGKIKVIKSSYTSLGGKCTVTVDHQQLSGLITVNGKDVSNLGSSISPIANRPSGVYDLIAYPMPSGYPPMPSGWLDPSGYCLPPSGTSIVPSGTWQQEEEFIFTWDEPSDWGYLATGNGYMVAWNDTEDYTLSQSDQYSQFHYIGKTWYDAGSMFFHVAARNSYGWIGSTSTYNVKINTLPSDPTTPFYIETLPNPSGLAYTSRPTFTWGNAEDEDQLDVLLYHLQVVPSGLSPNVYSSEVNFYDIPGADLGLTTSYKIDSDLLSGTFAWRVRAWDSKQYGGWSSWNEMEVTPISVDFSAKMSVVKPSLSNFGGKVTIKPYSDLWASLNVYKELVSELGGTITVSKPHDVEISAKLTIFSRADIGARISISPYEDLRAYINVFDVFGYSDVGAKIELNTYGDSELGCIINVGYKVNRDLGAMIYIIAIEDLGATMAVYTPESYGWIDEFNDDFSAKITVTRYWAKNLYGKITVIEDAPGEVVVSCNVAEATWQEENDIEFTWNAPTPGYYPTDGYFIFLDQNSGTEASDSFQRTTQTITGYDLEIYEGAGTYYFHIAARNTIGNFGPTTHFEVRYNHIPVNATGPMDVNGVNSQITNPMVGSLSNINFEWGQSLDGDTLDVIEYTMEVGTQYDFSADEQGNPTIVQTIEDIPTYYYTMLGGQVLSSNQYYWRIKANDGHQDSAGWSPVGQFVVNTPPGVPSDLTVYRY